MTGRAGLRAWRPAQMTSASHHQRTGRRASQAAPPERTYVEPSDGLNPDPLTQGATGAGHADHGVTTPRPITSPGWLA